MSSNLKDTFKKKVADPWAGTWSALIILIFVVVALVLLTTLRSNQALLDASQQTATVLAKTTMTLMPLADDAEFTPPIIDTNLLVAMAGLMLLLVLVVMLREVNWFRKLTKK